MLGGIAGIIITNAAYQSLLIAIGIRTLETLKILSFGTLAVGGLSLAGGSGYSLKKSLDAKKEQRLLIEEKEKKQIANYSQDTTNPDTIRTKLNSLKEKFPLIVEKCLGQMDKMDSYQERQRALINENAAVYLEDTISVLNNSEERICKTIRTIINYLVIFDKDSSDANDMSDSISDLLNSVDGELSSASKLLRYSVNYINNYEQNGIKDRSELDSWLETMQNAIESPSNEKLMLDEHNNFGLRLD